jgi:hypothetical protein
VIHDSWLPTFCIQKVVKTWIILTGESRNSANFSIPAFWLGSRTQSLLNTTTTTLYAVLYADCTLIVRWLYHEFRFRNRVDFFTSAVAVAHRKSELGTSVSPTLRKVNIIPIVISCFHAVYPLIGYRHFCTRWLQILYCVCTMYDHDHVSRCMHLIISTGVTGNRVSTIHIKHNAQLHSFLSETLFLNR